MKYLSDYTNDPISKHMDSLGAFFAFSNGQFNEKQVDGVDYVSLGAGMICPRENTKLLVDGLEDIHKKGIEFDLRDNGRKKIIERELSNHECFYTGDIEDCVDTLKDYGITEQEISRVFNGK